MIHRRKRNRSALGSGWFRFNGPNNQAVYGPGDGDFILLRDEFGKEWRGVAERQADDTIRLRFRDQDGRFITGVSDGYGVLLRDEKGNVWRGVLD